MTRPSIPARGLSADAVLSDLAAMKSADADWRGGRVFSLVYHAGEAHEQLLQKAHAMYASANLLNPVAFQSLKRMEAEIVGMAASLMHGPETTVGAVTSGGTESILVAMSAYRDRARKLRPWIRSPEIVCGRTAHPAFEKAAHYFGFTLRRVDVGDDLRVDMRAMAKAIGRNTIGLVVSAPQYPHGVIDHVEEASALARKHKLPLHVDACVGGWLLPWLEMIGRPVRPWDFRVPGVTSISADLHKYAYASKGASVVLWRSMDYMKYQFFVSTDFPGGIYASPTMIGTRPGGPIAAAWAGLKSLGEAGYMELARKSADAADQLRAGIAKIDGLRLLGDPDATIVAYGAAEGGPDVYAVADRLEARGWAADRMQHPAAIHLTCTANHLAIVDAYLRDLAAAVADVMASPELKHSGTAPMYGMVAKLPMRGMVASNVRKMMTQMYAPGVVVPDLTKPGTGVVDKFLDKYGPQVSAALDRLENARAVVGRVTGKARRPRGA
jgi:sphinganine-1-phosphate aldolase